MANKTPSKKKAVVKAKNRRRKVVIKESVKVRPKAAKTPSKDTLPIKSYIPDNGVTFKVKIRKK